MRRVPEGTKVLLHAEHAPYDAQKAHLYYEEHYKAHPRQKGTTFTVKTASGTVRVSAKELAKEKAYAAHRVDSIRTRLAELNAELKNKLANARKLATEDKKPASAADKAKAAKESKAYRQKHKQEISNKEKETTSKTKSLGSSSSSSKSGTESTHVDTADDLRVKIAAAKSSLSQAIARQRALASAKKSG